MSILVYHGSVEVVKQPEIRPITRPLDFGVGFYVTTIRERAEDWAKKKGKKANLVPVTNVYNFDLPALRQMLDVKIFENADDNWVDFVLKHRKADSYALQPKTPGKHRLIAKEGIHHSHDMVMGEVADDDIFDAIELYESEIITREELRRRLKTKRLNDQICFCTPEALKFLEFAKHY